MGNPKAVYHLRQQTPMIHFQHGEPGACLRASEVKPKLDRFLLEQLGGAEQVRHQHREWFIGKTDALDYKMRICGSGNVSYSTEIYSEFQKILEDDEYPPTDTETEYIKRLISEHPRIHKGGFRICKSYFGNQAKKSGDLKDYANAVVEQYKETVFYRDGIDMTIICFHDALKQVIENCVHAFFLIHNFGTRQNKGFGSFVVTAKDGQPFVCEDAQEELLKYSKMYGYDLYAVKQNGGLNAILELYQLLKSGKPKYIPYIYTKIEKHEKNWMRAQGLSVRTRVVPLKKEESELYHFYKAMLGLRDSIDYPKLGGRTIKIEHAEEDKDRNPQPLIQRFASPIIFKIVDSNRFFLLVYEAPDALFGQVFRFYDVDNKLKKYRITTPAKDTFSVKEFVRDFMQKQYPESEIKRTNTFKGLLKRK